MKKVKAVIAVWVVFVFAGSALATEATWTISYDPVDIYLSGTSYSFTFNLADAGFVAGEDSISSYSLYMDFNDDANEGADGDCSSDTATVTVDGINYAPPQKHCGSFGACRVIQDLTINYTGATSLNNTGLLVVNIAAVFGDFDFAAAILTATGIDNPSSSTEPDSPVPEPASILLVGLGLMGLAGVRRKNKK